jgi:hypothetical protein
LAGVKSRANPTVRSLHHQYLKPRSLNVNRIKDSVFRKFRNLDKQIPIGNRGLYHVKPRALSEYGRADKQHDRRYHFVSFHVSYLQKMNDYSSETVAPKQPQ